MRVGGAKAMSSTAKNTLVKNMKENKRKSTQPKKANAIPVTTQLVGLPLEELKYLRAEIRLG